jgi:hypothetical protein
MGLHIADVFSANGVLVSDIGVSMGIIPPGR